MKDDRQGVDDAGVRTLVTVRSESDGANDQSRGNSPVHSSMW